MIVDDEYCELCDDVAFPYDDETDYALCVVHKIAVETGYDYGDFEIDLDFLITQVRGQVHRGEFDPDKTCSMGYCKKPGAPRHNSENGGCRDWFLPRRSVISLCTKDAIGQFFRFGLRDVETWLDEIGDELLAE